jgi:hypothetical protein
VSHIHSIAYSPYGHAFENPVLFIQAGPGTASHSVLARLFDPSVYRFILVEYLTLTEYFFGKRMYFKDLFSFECFQTVTC